MNKDITQKILEMVENNKISADEAIKLIDALKVENNSSDNQKPSFIKEIMDDIQKTTTDVANQIKVQLQDEIANVKNEVRNEIINVCVKKVLKEVQNGVKDLSNIDYKNIFAKAVEEVRGIKVSDIRDKIKSDIDTVADYIKSKTNKKSDQDFEVGDLND